MRRFVRFVFALPLAERAQLDSERKDAQEILEAGKTVKFVLCGNATHLAPWHAKLGFMREYPVITMNSLTGDGGMVPSIDVVVEKVRTSLCGGSRN